ncbi:MAG: hypothetical protein AB7O26_04865 [Planctomycetaceae bacterium]
MGLLIATGGPLLRAQEEPKPAEAKEAPAAPQAEPASEGNPAAEGAPGANPTETLRGARERLSGASIRSVKARLIERVSIGDRKFTAEGSYLQGPDLKIRLEFRVSIGSGKGKLEGSLLEVCDGTVLWTRNAIGKQPRITRRNVRQILDAAKSSDLQTILTAELGLGGLPAVLASLDKSMDFKTQRDEQINGKTFTMIQGEWNEAYRERFKGVSKKGRLPEHIPDAVRVYFEPDILFPRRIEFLKRVEDGEKLSELVQLDLVDIVLNGPVDEMAFQFEKSENEFPVDITDAYLQQLNATMPAPAVETPAAPQ